ncbi:C4-dicarboxylate TRAP transporter substrate-binding protein [Albimonas pacifica]|uniref:TRAP-type C4-dicarboxylate transport system, substrate-binding protein n=1 Tax=Albimonas pacifica TaxID=1114924 RepID=A0A1I3MKM4_9RHOB|nr:C4-dicarboxylate TRAP transporter substrate-binding protein [Albimonas pacifica]SFI97539.1 TRAP-type C4-dicarboxylate transport system, substrate-binding protein [Albimonas pacifica]
MKTFAKWATAAAVATLVAAPALAAERITATLWVGPKHPVSVGGYDPFIEAVEASGDFEVKYFQGGALLGAKPAMAGIGDGIADVGMLAMTYFPAEFPNAQLVADMGLSTPNNIVAMAMATEFNLLHCPDCLAEYEAQNLIYTGTYSTSPYTIISKEPIRSTADLAGKKMRVPGSLWSRWAQSVGGIEVNVPSSEMFEGLDKGALDIAIQAPGALRSYSLWDTAKYNTLLNLGTYHSLSMMTWNADRWAEFSPEQRKMLLAEAGKASLGATVFYTTSDEEVLAEAKEHGVEIIEPSDEMRATKDEFVAADVDAIIQTAVEQHGIADAAEKVKVLKGLIDKWAAIVEEVGEDDVEGIQAKLQSEIYDKLPADYGA